MTAMEEYINLGKQFDEAQLKAAVRILRAAAERWEAEGDDEGWGQP